MFLNLHRGEFSYGKTWFKLPKALISPGDVSFLQALPPPGVTSRNAQAGIPGLSGWGSCWKKVPSWRQLSSAWRASRWAEIMTLVFRGSNTDCGYMGYRDVEDWAKYVAELAFQAFLIKTPSRGCCYISEWLESTVAPTMSLGFSLGSKGVGALLLSHVTTPALSLGVELMENSFNWANLTKAHIH